jgi:hypothetical protein
MKGDHGIVPKHKVLQGFRVKMGIDKNNTVSVQRLSNQVILVQVLAWFHMIDNYINRLATQKIKRSLSVHNTGEIHRNPVHLR